MGQNVINWPRFTVVLTVLLFLLSGIPNVSSQQNPYAPEIDYSCVGYWDAQLEGFEKAFKKPIWRDYLETQRKLLDEVFSFIIGSTIVV